MSQALYRRYRSTSLQDVVGQEHVTDLLQRAVEQNAISHAYLFTGPRGVGKTSVARIMAHIINEIPYSSDTHLDIIEIDAASNRRIDDVRDLREKVHIAPSAVKYKVYIIDEVHMLTGESFNALLKTLEEPPAHAVFILATTEIHKVPATIISRTQRFHFKPGSINSIKKHLKSVTKNEEIKIDNDALTLVAEHSDGSFRDALSLLDQITGGASDKISKQQVEQALGVAPRESLEGIIEAIVNGETSKAVSAAQQLLEEGVSAASISHQLARIALTQATQFPQLYTLVAPLLEVPKSHASELKMLALVGSAALSNESPNSNQTRTVASAISQPKPISEKPLAAPTLKTTEPKTAQDTSADITDAKTAQDTSVEKTDAAPIKSTQGDTEKGESIAISWDKILDVAQKRAPALYGVLKRAKAECSSEEVVLTFQYALHRKKLSDAKYSSQLSGIIQNTFNCTPLITITDTSQKPLTEEASSVAAIMGGGKPINA